jgi:hypothetical protein
MARIQIENMIPNCSSREKYLGKNALKKFRYVFREEVDKLTTRPAEITKGKPETICIISYFGGQMCHQSLHMLTPGMYMKRQSLSKYTTLYLFRKLIVITFPLIFLTLCRHGHNS